MNNKDTSFKAGMYLLETLTAGMYNEPLSIFREYIQNAVDSIDFGLKNNIDVPKKVNIQLDPFNKQIQINDSGFGISSLAAEKTLSSIGSSTKVHNGFRGFRGIGRLGGIAFSDKTIFRTKAEGEVVESVQEWDCIKLRQLLSDSSKTEMPIEQLFSDVTSFNQVNGKPESGSYFNVELEGVTSFRNYLFDINRVHNYLSQIAPVPYNPDEFKFENSISDFLEEKLSHYGVYEITLNDEPIYKPYRNSVKITKKGYDDIEHINTFEIVLKDKPVAYGWYGIRKDLLGAISRGENCSGIRVRAGNILIGDSHLLDGCFREPRFNSYVIGEIHVDCKDLVPNSRRDDFVDNDTKTLFYNAIEREIGHTISKEIRLKSRISSDKKEQVDIGNAVKDNQSVANTSDVKIKPPELDKKKNDTIFSNENEIKDILSICSHCQNFDDILSKVNELIDSKNKD